MDRRYQVFVSSTFRDLRLERQEVIQVLLEMDCIPAAMELFPAANETVWSLIKGVIDDCDYYIVIVGGRYGSTTTEGVSFTEKEYDYAVDQGKPVLGFVHEDPDSLSVRDTDIDPAARDALAAFRTKVLSRPSRTYATAEQLGSVISRSLMQAIKKEPGEGWVRGRFATSQEKEEEISRLRAELAETRLKIETSLTTDTLGLKREELQQGSDPLVLTVAARWLEEDSETYTRKAVPVQTTWDEVFRAIGPEMVRPVLEIRVSELIKSLLHRRVLALDVDMKGKKFDAFISSEDFQQVLQQFRALGYIQPGPLMGGRRSWENTPDGDVYMAQIFALRRTPASPASDGA